MNSDIPSLTAKTTILTGVAIIVGLLALFDTPSPVDEPNQSATVAKLNPDHVSRIELTHATVKTVLERDELTRDWRITAPLDQEADEARISHLLAAFRRPVAADVTIDDGTTQEYGLDAADGIVVELWTGATDPAASFTVGNDGPGGSSFVRISGQTAVHRARVGGRRRFDRQPRDWRNRVVVDRNEPDIQGIRIEPWNGSIVHMVREPTEGETGDGAWAFDPPDGLTIEAGKRMAAVSRLGSMRAATILDDDFEGGFSPPAANITVMDKEGTEVTLAVGRKEADGVTFVRVAGKEGVYAVPKADIAPFVGATAPVSKLSLYKVLEPNIAKLIFYQKRTKVEIGRSGDSGVWLITNPPGLASDVADVQFALRTLSSPRAGEEVPGASAARLGLTRPRMVFEVQRVDGSHEALFVGRHFKRNGQIYFYVKSQNGDQVYTLDEPTLSRLRRAFGQN